MVNTVRKKNGILMSFFGDLKGPWEGLKHSGDGASSNLVGIICPRLRQPCLVLENVFWLHKTNSQRWVIFELTAITKLISATFYGASRNLSYVTILNISHSFAWNITSIKLCMHSNLNIFILLSYKHKVLLYFIIHSNT